MEIKKIYFDMDGVLVDFKKGVKEICGLETPSQDNASKEEEDRLWEAIKAAGHFYDMLEPIPGAIELFKEVANKYECAILSAPPKPKRNILTAEEDKISWVNRYLGPGIEINIVPKEEKKNKARGKGYILIDDFSRNVEGWQECGGTGILFESVEDTRIKIKEIEENGL